jgi:hypothetical protein
MGAFLVNNRWMFSTRSFRCQGAGQMPSQELFECVESPLLRTFLRDNLAEFLNDVRVFSEEVLANVPAKSRPFVRDAGLAFYSAPITSLLPDFPWETVKAGIAAGISGVFPSDAGGQGKSGKVVPFTFEKDPALAERIEQVIVAAFAELHKSAGGAAGLIVIGGMANLFGKCVALYIAGILLDKAANRLDATGGETCGACTQTGSLSGRKLERLIRDAAGNACQGNVLHE